MWGDCKVWHHIYLTSKWYWSGINYSPEVPLNHLKSKTLSPLFLPSFWSNVIAGGKSHNKRRSTVHPSYHSMLKLHSKLNTTNSALSSRKRLLCTLIAWRDRWIDLSNARKRITTYYLPSLLVTACRVVAINTVVFDKPLKPYKWSSKK